MAERTDADLLRLIAKDYERLAPNAHHSAETLRQIAARLTTDASEATAIPAGMKPWGGGCRPNDIDTSEPVIFPYGQTAVPDDYDHPPLWRQVIAYTPKVASEAAAPRLREALEARRVEPTDDWNKGWNAALESIAALSVPPPPSAGDAGARTQVLDMHANAWIVSHYSQKAVAAIGVESPTFNAAREAFAAGAIWGSVDAVKDGLGRIAQADAIIAGSATDAGVLREAVDWLLAISTWLLTHDHDMTLPDGVLDTDPLDIADRLAALSLAIDSADKHTTHSLTEGQPANPQKSVGSGAQLVSAIDSADGGGGSARVDHNASEALGELVFTTARESGE